MSQRVKRKGPKNCRRQAPTRIQSPTNLFSEDQHESSESIPSHCKPIHNHINSSPPNSHHIHHTGPTYSPRPASNSRQAILLSKSHQAIPQLDNPATQKTTETTGRHSSKRRCKRLDTIASQRERPSCALLSPNAEADS